MQSSRMHKTKAIVAALTLFFLIAPEASLKACAKTDDVTNFVRNHGSSDEKELYETVYQSFLASMQNFMHNRFEHDGKNLSWFIKDWISHNKAFFETAKKCQGPVHKRILKLHKDLDRFIKLLHKHQNSGVVIILAQLAQNPDLTELIPAEAGWDPASVMQALNSRCR